MADIEIGTDELDVVACAAIRDALAGIEFDGKPMGSGLGLVFPKDTEDLPVNLVHAFNASISQGGGRTGSRVERWDLMVTVTSVFSIPIVKLDEFHRKVGLVQAEVRQRLAATPHLSIDGNVLATEFALQRKDQGFAGGGQQSVIVNRLQYGCTIHTREGERLPLSY